MATNPTLLAMPIAENGQKNTIPATQAAAGDGLLSQSTGFPPETALPLGAGGKAPTREDFNGAFNLLSDIAFYAQKGWFFQFDAAQAYFAGCVVRDTTDGVLYEAINDVAAGGDVPSSDSDNWKKFFPVGKTIGEIFPYAGTTQPAGALLCNGAAVSRTMYPDLFDEIGTTYGAGDGSTTFNLPNKTNASTVDGYTKTAYESAGSYTFTAPKSGTYKITVKGAGGGGAGASAATACYGGGGGGEGGTSFAWEHLNAGDTVTVVVGAGGAGGLSGTTSGGAGGNGGDTTATIALTTYTGGGGKGAGTHAASTWFIGGDGGSGIIVGSPGESGSHTENNGYAASGGSGGGNGGGRSSTNSAAEDGVQGGGGSGGTSFSGTYSGGAGGDGYCWIEFVGTSDRWYIQAFNSSTDPALVDLTQIVQDLANKLTREQTPAFNKRDIVTTSGTYTAPVTGWYKITVKGGGGGGGGGNSKNTSNNILIGGGGGGEGGTTIGFEKMTAGDTATVVIGAGGSGGAVSANGSNGGNSSVTVNNNTYTCGGGGAGTALGAAGQGGSGLYCGASGTAADSTYVGSSSFSTQFTAGGGSGAKIGANSVDGGGGCGGFGGSVTSPSAGFSGGDGYAWFEYFDPTLM